MPAVRKEIKVGFLASDFSMAVTPSTPTTFDVNDILSERFLDGAAGTAFFFSAFLLFRSSLFLHEANGRLTHRVPPTVLTQDKHSKPFHRSY